MNLINFEYSQFDSPDLPKSGVNMNKEFLLLLDNAASYSAVPFNINSGFRTPSHNKQVGGSPTSSHLFGLAADISASSSINRYIILHSLMLAGFTRFGIGKTYIHVDFDLSKPPNVVWLY
jgi:hypothetical protein